MEKIVSGFFNHSLFRILFSSVSFLQKKDQSKKNVSNNSFFMTICCLESSTDGATKKRDFWKRCELSYAAVLFKCRIP